MPAETQSSSKRLSGSRDHAQVSTVAHSPADHQSTQKQSGAQSHKQQRSGKLGARKSSVGRNLSKLTLTAPDDDDSAGKGANAPPLSPRHKSGIKRSHAVGSHMPRNASTSVLRKNHSSGHLTRNVSGKQLSKSHRPDYNRTRSHDDRKSKQRLRSPSPAPPPRQATGRHASVRFDMGDDDDEAENMEGVEDPWTEESASQSPNTTRDNTRSNTRSNSVVLEPAAHGDVKTHDDPTDEADEDDASGTQARDNAASAQESGKQESPQTQAPRKSSYHEAMHHPRPPDAEAIAKRLLQRNESSRISLQPQISDISVTTSSSSPQDPSQEGSGSLPRLQAHTSPPSSSSTTLVSRFLDTSSSQPGSNDGTPVTSTTLSGAAAAAAPPAPPHRGTAGPQRSALRHRDRDAAIRRNQSTPSFMLPDAETSNGLVQPAPSRSGVSSGTSTPGGGGGSITPGAGPGRTSRTQAKLWLQRGLSNIEANSQSNLQGMLNGGGGANAFPSEDGGMSQQMMLLRRGLSAASMHNHGGGGGGAVGGGIGLGLGGMGSMMMVGAVGQLGHGSVMGAAERVERQLVAVRRHRSPIEESIERLRRRLGKRSLSSLDGKGQGGAAAAAVVLAVLGDSVATAGAAKQGARGSRQAGPQRPTAGGAGKQPAVAVVRSRANSPGGNMIAGEGRASSYNSTGSAGPPAAAAEDGEDDSGEGGGARSKRGEAGGVAVSEWVNLRLDELEEATLEVRRQMWELQSGGGDEDAG